MGLGLALTGCSEEAQTSECALIIGNGGGEAHTVKEIVYPGESRSDEGDDWTRFVPCGPRNFIINPDNNSHTGDWHEPVLARSKVSEDGKVERREMKVWIKANFEVNQDKNMLKQFWVFSQKYGAFSDTSHDNDANFSTDGWNGLLRENLLPAIQRSVATAMANYPPDIYKTQEKWGDFTNDVSANIMKELRTEFSGQDFLCGRGSNSREKGECKPIRFTMEQPGIEPKDQAIVDIDNRAQQAYAEQSQDQQRIDRTNKLYGQYADYYRGLQDTVDKCNGKQNCQIIIGDPRNGK